MLRSQTTGTGSNPRPTEHRSEESQEALGVRSLVGMALSHDEPHPPVHRSSNRNKTLIPKYSQVPPNARESTPFLRGRDLQPVGSARPAAMNACTGHLLPI